MQSNISADVNVLNAEVSHSFTIVFKIVTTDLSYAVLQIWSLDIFLLQTFVADLTIPLEVFVNLFSVICTLILVSIFFIFHL
jgi:hypothetical protein